MGLNRVRNMFRVRLELRLCLALGRHAGMYHLEFALPLE